MNNTSVLGTIRDNLELLFSAEQKVARYIMIEPNNAAMMNVSELANASGVSDATVVRMCKHIGYEGYYQMKLLLSRELGRSVLQETRQGRDPKSIREMLEIQAANLLDMARNISLETLLSSVQMIKESSMTYVIAAGNTAPIAQDLGWRLARQGIRTSHYMLVEYYMAAIHNARSDELVIAISRSGSSRQVLQTVELARKNNMKCIAITEHQNSPLSKLSDLLLLTKGENPLLGEEYTPVSHLREMSANDLLVYAVQHEEALAQKVHPKEETQGIDQVEYMLSEYKL